MAKLAEISRIDQKRYLDVKADVTPGLMKVVKATRVRRRRHAGRLPLCVLHGQDADFAIDGASFQVTDLTAAAQAMDLQSD